MVKKALPCAFLLFLVLSARDAAAQVGAPWTDLGYFNLSLGFESVSGELNDASTFRLYDEDASLSVAQAIDSGAFFDVAGGARIWRNVSVGVGFHQGSTHGDAAVSGQVPHPLFFNRNRAVATSVGDLRRRERAIHLQFGYMLVLSPKIDVHFTAGPSFFKLRQDLVSAISVAEQGAPFTTVTATPTVIERQDTSTGFNIGGDLAFKVIETAAATVGVGMFVRYAGASATIQVLSNAVDSDVGGLQVGFGGRLRW